MSLGDALSPLLVNLPRTLVAEEELRKQGNHPFLAANLVDKNDADAILTQDAEEGGAQGYDSDFNPSDPTDITIDHGEQTSRGLVAIEGADQAFDLTSTTVRSMMKKKLDATPFPELLRRLDFWSAWITPDPNVQPNFVMKWLHPEIFDSYHVLRDAMPTELREMEMQYGEGVLRGAYSKSSVRDKSPRLWIPRDEGGVSVQEVMHSGRVVEISDQGAWLDDKGRLVVDMEGEMSRWVRRDWEGVRF